VGRWQSVHSSSGFGKQHRQILFTATMQYWQQADYDGVIRCCNVLIELNLHLRIIYAMRGLARCNKGNYEAALADLNRAVELSKNDPSTLSMTLVNRAHCHRQQGSADAAIEDCRKAIEMANRFSLRSGPVQQVLAYAHMNRALAHSSKGTHMEAMADAEVAVNLGKLLGRDVQSFAHADRGSVFGAQSDLTSAQTEFDAALKLAGSQPYPKAWAYWRRSLFLAAQGDRDGAIRDCTAAVEVCPQLVDPYRTRGDQYKAIGDMQQANADYQKVDKLRSDPTHPLDPAKLSQMQPHRRMQWLDLAIVAMFIVVVLLVILLLVFPQPR